jgi:hypothetical protein
MVHMLCLQSMSARAEGGDWRLKAVQVISNTKSHSSNAAARKSNIPAGVGTALMQRNICGRSLAE